MPLVLLVGGATGTGKSTITTEVAHRLGITRVTSTDFVRQTMRAFFSEAFMPSHPLLELRGGRRGRRRRSADSARREPARLPRADAQRPRRRRGERGAGADRGPLDGARGRPPRARGSCRATLDGRDRLAVRDRDPGRGGARAPLLRARRSTRRACGRWRSTCDALPEIRRIQELLIERAEEAGVPVIENADREQARRRGAPARPRHVRARRPVQAVTERETLCRCEAFAAVTERAAVAAGRWLGRGDVAGAEDGGVGRDARGARPASRSRAASWSGASDEDDPLGDRDDRRRRRRAASTSPSTRSRARRSSRAATWARCR